MREFIKWSIGGLFAGVGMAITLLALFVAVDLLAAPIVLQNKSDTTYNADSTVADTIPPRAHSLFIDTTTMADTAGWSIEQYKAGHRWPDSVLVKLRSVNWGILEWNNLAPFIKDSVETVEGYRLIWRSGSTTLPDSVIAPGRYEVSGDTLVE